jgi:hypothetical protein
MVIETDISPGVSLQKSRRVVDEFMQAVGGSAMFIRASRPRRIGEVDGGGGSDQSRAWKGNYPFSICFTRSVEPMPDLAFAVGS